MEKELLSLMLPQALLDHFEVEHIEQGTIKHSVARYIKLYLTEKPILPEGLDASEWESKGFHEPKTIQDFPIRGKMVHLVIKRRRWRNKLDPSQVISRDLSFLAKGTKMTADLAAFLKGTGRISR